MAAAAVPPQYPGNLRQFGVSGLRPQIEQPLLKRCGRTVAGITPPLAIRLFGLLIKRGEQGAILFLRQSLPVQVKGSREPRLTRSLAATC